MTASTSLLVRKVRSGGLARSPLAETAQIGEALARRIEERMRFVSHCAVDVRTEICRVSRLGDATAGIGTPAMIGLLTFPGAETRSLAAIDSALAWHLTDLTLGGEATEAPTMTVRSFTAIDLALGQIHLAPIAEALSDAISHALGRDLPARFALDGQRQTIAQVRLAADHVDVLHVRLQVALGPAGRGGCLDMAIPLATLDTIRAAAAREGAAEARGRPDDLWRTAMRQAAASAPVRLRAVLHRERMTLAAISRLRPGQVIEIDPDAPRQVALMLDQPDGRSATVVVAQLGAYGENKVLRLRDALEPRLARHVAQALALPRMPHALAATAAPARLPAPDDEREAVAEAAPLDHPAS